MAAGSEQRSTRVVEWIAGIFVVGGLIAWAWVFQRDPTLLKAASLGNAVGPIATLVTAAALFVGFNSLRIQREALEGQQDEITRTLKELGRTADAQEALARVERRAVLVNAKSVRTQIEANRHQWFMDLAQRRANAAALLGTIADVDIALATAAGNALLNIQAKLMPVRQRAESELAMENVRILALERSLSLEPDRHIAKATRPFGEGE